MIFGNWEVEEEGIVGIGRLSKYFIPKEQFTLKMNSNLYSWLIHYSEKADVTEQNIYELNTAFVYALEHFQIGFATDLSFKMTFEKQKEIISEKNGDNESEANTPFDIDDILK